MGIDGRPFQGSRTGVGRYVAELCLRLDQLLPRVSFRIYSHVPIEPPVRSARWSVHLDPFSQARHLKAIAWLKLRCGTLAARDGVDVFWGSATLLPRLPSRIKTLATVFDLNYLVAPDSMVGTHQLAHRMFFARDLRRADALTAISQGTADKVRQWFGRTIDAVALPAASAAFRPMPPESYGPRLEALKIDAPYILGVATWEPRKNLATLIRAFLEMKEGGRLGNRKLVLAGGKGWKDGQLLSLLSGRTLSDIIPLGYVADADLPVLYSGCDAFVFPSLYEGFGMPVLEARACGAPVVASDFPELREAGGPDACYVQPTSEGLSTGLISVLSAPRPRHAAGGLPTWDAGAEKLSKLLLALR